MKTRIALTAVLALLAVVGFPQGAQATGELTPAGCVDSNDSGSDTCAQSVSGLTGTRAVATSPDGLSVYALSGGPIVVFPNDNALVRFDRLASGALVPSGCIDDNDTGSDECDQTTDGLHEASSLAVSPDGKSVYATSTGDSALVHFSRTPTGALIPAGCVVDNDGAPEPCAQSVNGLFGASSVAVSPDGKSVYVASALDHALVRFNRSTTGALTPGGCVDDNDVVADVCAQSVNGLSRPIAVAVSPDGTSVYVTSDLDHAVVRFNRSTTGALTPGGCVDDNDIVGDVCAQSVNGLTGPESVAVSPDGKSVYVTSVGDDAVVRFNRSTSGALTPAGCVDDNDSGPDACGQSVNGLEGARSVAVSTDGKSAYVTSVGDSAVVRFNRSTSGALTPAGCVDDNDTGHDVCSQSVNGLGAAVAVVVSSDGKSVYVASGFDDAVVRFNRAV